MLSEWGSHVDTVSACLQALVKHLDDISDEVIPDVHIPNGIPMVYELNDKLKAVRHYCLDDTNS